MCDDPRCRAPGTVVLVRADGPGETVRGTDPLREAVLRAVWLLVRAGEVGPGRDAQLMATGPDFERVRVLVVQEEA